MQVTIPSLLSATTPQQLIASLVTYARSEVIQNEQIQESTYGLLIEAAHSLPTLQEVDLFLCDYKSGYHPEIIAEDGTTLTGNEILALRLCAVWCASIGSQSDWGSKVRFSNLAWLADEHSEGALLATHAPIFIDSTNGRRIPITKKDVKNLQSIATERGVL